MARCTDCIHYEACLKFADIRVILCGDKADTKCTMFKPTADVAPRAEIDKLQEVNADLNESLRLACEGNKDLQAAIAEVRAEVAREIFEKIAQIKKEYASGDIDGDTLYVMLHLLEKKYTEATP